MNYYSAALPPVFDDAVYDCEGKHCGRIRELYCEPATGQVLFADIEMPASTGNQICVSIQLLELHAQASGFVLHANPSLPERR